MWPQEGLLLCPCSPLGEWVQVYEGKDIVPMLHALLMDFLLYENVSGFTKLLVLLHHLSISWTLAQSEYRAQLWSTTSNPWAPPSTLYQGFLFKSAWTCKFSAVKFRELPSTYWVGQYEHHATEASQNYDYLHPSHPMIKTIHFTSMGGLSFQGGKEKREGDSPILQMWKEKPLW